MEALETLLTYLKDPETPFGVVDPLYSTFLVFGLVRGFFRGLPEEVARVAGTFLVLMGSRIFYQPVSDALMRQTMVEREETSTVLAYFLLVVVFFVIWRITILIIKKALDWTFPDLTHRPGGALIGLAKSGLILCVALTVVQLSGIEPLQEHTIQRSWVGRRLSVFLPQTIEELEQDWLPGESETTEPETEDHGSGNA